MRRNSQLEYVKSTLASIGDLLRHTAHDQDHQITPMQVCGQEPIENLFTNFNYQRMAKYSKSTELTQSALLEDVEPVRRHSVSSLLNQVLNEAPRQVPHIDQSDISIMTRVEPSNKRARMTEACSKG